MSLFKNNFVVGITSALAVTILAPVLFPAIKRSSRPLAKSVIKGGLALYEMGREAVANGGEVIEDVMAEIHAEQAAKQDVTPQSEASENEAPMQGNGSVHASPMAGDVDTDRQAVMKGNA